LSERIVNWRETSTSRGRILCFGDSCGHRVGSKKVMRPLEGVDDVRFGEKRRKLGRPERQSRESRIRKSGPRRKRRSQTDNAYFHQKRDTPHTQIYTPEPALQIMEEGKGRKKKTQANRSNLLRTPKESRNSQGTDVSCKKLQANPSSKKSDDLVKRTPRTRGGEKKMGLRGRNKGQPRTANSNACRLKSESWQVRVYGGEKSTRHPHAVSRRGERGEKTLWRKSRGNLTV